MTQDLVPVRTRDLMPLTMERGHDLDHVPETWGLYPGVLPRDALDREPPTRDVLEAMQDELASALVPARAHPEGVKAVAAYAAQLVESFPMRDGAGTRYGDALVERLQDLPADLLPKVIRQLVDESDFRPSAKQVQAVVREALARRRLLLLRVQAGLRYWDWKAEQRAIEAERTARVSAAATANALRMPRDPGSRASAKATPNKPSPKPAYVSSAKLRAHRTAKTQLVR